MESTMLSRLTSFFPYKTPTDQLSSRICYASSTRSTSTETLNLETDSFMEALDTRFLEDTPGFLKRCIGIFSIENFEKVAILLYPLVHLTVGFSSLALQIGCGLLSLVALAITVGRFLFESKASPSWATNFMEGDEDSIELSGTRTPDSLLSHLDEESFFENTYGLRSAVMGPRSAEMV